MYSAIDFYLGAGNPNSHGDRQQQSWPQCSLTTLLKTKKSLQP